MTLKKVKIETAGLMAFLMFLLYCLARDISNIYDILTLKEITLAHYVIILIYVVLMIFYIYYSVKLHTLILNRVGVYIAVMIDMMDHEVYNDRYRKYYIWFRNTFSVPKYKIKTEFDGFTCISTIQMEEDDKK